MRQFLDRQARILREQRLAQNALEAQEMRARRVTTITPPLYNLPAMNQDYDDRVWSLTW